MSLQLVRTEPDAPFEDLDADHDFQGRARREGTEFKVYALEYLEGLGCTILEGRHHVAHYPVDALVRTAGGRRLIVACHGVFDDGHQAGLRRCDTVHKLGHRAHALHRRTAAPLLVVTSHLPLPGTQAARYLADLHEDLGDWLVDVIATTGDLAGRLRFACYAGSPTPTPQVAAPWWSAVSDAPEQGALRFAEVLDA